MKSEDDVKKTLAKYRDALMSRPNVNGVGIGEDIAPDGRTRKFIQVYVSKKVPPEELSRRELVPEELDGVEVRIREIGRLALE